MDNEPIPANLDAEKVVLGMMVLDQSKVVYSSAVSRLLPDDFSLDSHRRLFATMIEVVESGEPLDYVTILERLGQRGEIEAVGGAVYVLELGEGVPRIIDVEPYIRILKNKSSLRKIIHISNGAIAAAYEQASPASHILGTLEDQLLTLLGNGQKNAAERLSEFSGDVFNLLNERRQQHGLIGLSTGIDRLDGKTTGIRTKEFWCIGGRTGDGKTALGLQMAKTNASAGIPVGYFSLEMDKASLLERIWASVGKVEYEKIRNPNLLDEHDLSILGQIKRATDEWPLFVEDSEAYSISEISARSRLMVKQHKVRLIIVDYLQIVDAPGREEKNRLTNISKTLRSLAKSEDVAIVGLSQMPRPKDGSLNKRPNKFDLKESGSLENNSNTVLLVYRPVDSLDQYIGEDEIVIGKQRSGQTGLIPVYYNGKYMRFESREVYAKEAYAS